MPLSKTDICNMALAHCGVGARIQDVDTDTSNAGTQCNLFYDHCRRLLLEMRPWAFARERVTLQSLGSPFDDWTWRYNYPNNCALALKIVNPALRTPGRDQKIPFDIVNIDDGTGRAILTDQDDAVLEFNNDVEDVNLFTRTFGIALSYFVASFIAMPLRADPKVTAYVNQQFGYWLSEASTLDSREASEDPEPVSEFQRIRG